MKKTVSLMVLPGAVLLGVLSWPSTTAAAQSGTRFQGMDLNRDGVISRDEWRGNNRSFRQLDRNGDGVLSSDELRDEVGTSGSTAGVAAFDFVDLDRNGRVTAQEWMRAFNELDANRDGVLTEGELGFEGVSSAGSGPTEDERQTVAHRSGRERGLSDGRQAGREDRSRGTWDLEGQRELERADAGYREAYGPLDLYQAGYREAFREGYAQGYGRRD